MCAKLWNEERIERECERIRTSPSKEDNLRAFAHFVEQGCYPWRSSRVGKVSWCSTRSTAPGGLQPTRFSVVKESTGLSR
jgi:hypothetical protein